MLTDARPTLQAAGTRLVLASGSTTRGALLRSAGLVFQQMPADLDEAAVKARVRAAGASAGDAAMALAAAKADAVAAAHPGAIVIGADQILEADGAWFDKPADPAAAADHLRALRGRTHTLATAVVCRQGEAPAWRHLATPRLTMRPVSDAFIDAYVAREGEAICASVGAYRLEGLGVHLFSAIDGEHAAILGLPLLALLAELRRRGVVLT